MHIIRMLGCTAHSMPRQILPLLFIRSRALLRLFFSVGCSHCCAMAHAILVHGKLMAGLRYILRYCGDVLFHACPLKKDVQEYTVAECRHAIHVHLGPYQRMDPPRTRAMDEHEQWPLRWTVTARVQVVLQQI